MVWIALKANWIVTVRVWWIWRGIFADVWRILTFRVRVVWHSFVCQYYTSGELETESVDLPFVEMEYPDVLTEQRQPYTMKTAFFFANADTSGYNRIAKVNLPETPGDATQKYVYIGKEDKISHLAKVSQPNYIHLLFLRAFSSN